MVQLITHRPEHLSCFVKECLLNTKPSEFRLQFTASGLGLRNAKDVESILHFQDGFPTAHEVGVYIYIYMPYIYIYIDWGFDCTRALGLPPSLELGAPRAPGAPEAMNRRIWIFLASG